jgi:hypothetical protein
LGKNREQSAIAETGVRGGLDQSQKLLNFTFDEAGVFPSVRENLSVLTSGAGFMRALLSQSARKKASGWLPCAV